MGNEINMMPEFDGNDAQRGAQLEPQAPVTEEVKESAEEAPIADAPEAELEKETPTEPPAEEEPTAEEPEGEPEEAGVEEISQHERAIAGLKAEKDRILKEVVDLKGQRREMKQEELVKVQEDIDELADVNKADVELVEKILRSKGYIKQDEVKKMSYDARKKEEINKFLEKYPEYKVENDPHNVNWDALQRQVRNWYRTPEDASKIGAILIKAHEDLNKDASPKAANIAAKKRAVKVASTGSGGAQRSSATGSSLSPEQIARFKSGGWTDEEIANMGKK